MLSLIHQRSPRVQHFGSYSKRTGETHTQTWHNTGPVYTWSLGWSDSQSTWDPVTQSFFRGCLGHIWPRSFSSVHANMSIMRERLLSWRPLHRWKYVLNCAPKVSFKVRNHKKEPQQWEKKKLQQQAKLFVMGESTQKTQISILAEEWKMDDLYRNLWFMRTFQRR